MGAIGNVTVVLAALVADDATFTAPYPTGVTRNMLLTSSGGRMVVDGDAAYAEGASGFTVAYGASSMTITNTTGASLAAGSEIVLSFGEFPDDGVYNLAATDVQKIAQDGPRRRLSGFILEGKRAARQNMRIVSADGSKEVGFVTSGCWSPTLEKSIAMGYVESALSAPGNTVVIDPEKLNTQATTCALPFYKSGS